MIENIKTEAMGALTGNEVTHATALIQTVSLCFPDPESAARCHALVCSGLLQHKDAPSLDEFIEFIKKCNEGYQNWKKETGHE
jgi:hypothetical protein